MMKMLPATVSPRPADLDPGAHRLPSMSANGAGTGIRLLTDPTRMRILGLIQESLDGRALVGRLAAELELTQPTVSHHVKLLHDAGVLDRVPEGRVAWYSIAPSAADRVHEVLRTDAADGAMEYHATRPSGTRSSTPASCRSFTW